MSMNSFTLIVGLVLSTMSSAEVWEKPPYVPDEGHLQEEIEKQEEAPRLNNKNEKVKKAKVKTNIEKKDNSSPSSLSF